MGGLARCSARPDPAGLDELRQVQKSSQSEAVAVLGLRRCSARGAAGQRLLQNFLASEGLPCGGHHATRQSCGSLRVRRWVPGVGLGQDSGVCGDRGCGRERRSPCHCHRRLSRKLVAAAPGASGAESGAASHHPFGEEGTEVWGGQRPFQGHRQM